MCGWMGYGCLAVGVGVGVGVCIWGGCGRVGWVTRNSSLHISLILCTIPTGAEMHVSVYSAR